MRKTALLLTSLVWVGCQAAQPVGPPSPVSPPPPRSEQAAVHAQPSAPVPMTPVAAPSPDVVQGTTRFAADLYGRLKSAPGNLSFSPTSVSTALALAFAGARGETAEQMARVLHFPSDSQKLHESLGALQRRWNASDAKGPELRVANRLWCQSGLTLEPSYERTTQTHYGASAGILDFRADPEPARATINHWVEDKTNDKIQELLKRGNVTGSTRMIITNAVYFKGAWLTPFSKHRTQDEPFFTAPKKSHPVAMMRLSATVNYADLADAQVIELLYAGRDPSHGIALVVVLPKKKDGLSELTADLTKEKLASWTEGLASRRVEITLPRFKTTSEIELAKILSEMGMAIAFTDRADFSGVSKKEPLEISAVVHKAFVDVNEEGTEAAAATGVVMRTTSAIIGPIPKFRADHPFFFMLRDRETRSVLFMGRVSDPAQS